MNTLPNRHASFSHQYLLALIQDTILRNYAQTPFIVSIFTTLAVWKLSVTELFSRVKAANLGGLARSMGNFRVTFLSIEVLIRA